MIPKIIHYVWLGGKEIPEEHKKYIEGWKKIMPDYKFMFWNEDNFDFSKSPYASEAYANKKFGFVPDYIRAKVLSDFGGIYLDTDVEVLKPFDNLLHDGMFTCFENDAYTQTAILGAEPHHPFFASLVEFYENHHFIKNGECDLTPSPFYFTYFLNKDFGMKLNAKTQTLTNGEKSVAVYTADYFAPINFTTKKLTVTENTYAIHHFANSWANKKQRREQKLTLFLYKAFGKKFFAFCTRVYTKNYFKKLEKEDKKNKYSLWAKSIN